MNKYIYARLFVRASKLIALLVILGGFGLIFKNAYLTKSQLEATDFHLSHECYKIACSIDTCYANTKKIVLDSLEQSQFYGSNVKILDVRDRINQITSLSESESPALYSALANDLIDSSNQIKEYHKKELYDCIERLRKSLMQHAVALKNELNLPTSASNVQPSVTAANGVSSYRIFGDGYDETRNEFLNKINARLTAIQQESTKSENIEAVTIAIKDISILSKLLVNDRAASSPNQNSTTIHNETSVPQVNAEKLAYILLNDENDINTLFYTNWLLDKNIEKLYSESASELKRKNDLKRQRTSIIINAITYSVLIIIETVALAFFLFVISDLVKAFLNMSINTDIFKAYASNADDVI